MGMACYTPHTTRHRQYLLPQPARRARWVAAAGMGQEQWLGAVTAQGRYAFGLAYAQARSEAHAKARLLKRRSRCTLSTAAGPERRTSHHAQMQPWRAQVAKREHRRDQRGEGRDVLWIEREDTLQELSRVDKIESVVREEKGVPE